MTETESQMLREIHATVVKGTPANDQLLDAARNVVKIRYSRETDWTDLNEAIRDLASVVNKDQKP